MSAVRLAREGSGASGKVADDENRSLGGVARAAGTMLRLEALYIALRYALSKALLAY